MAARLPLGLEGADRELVGWGEVVLLEVGLVANKVRLARGGRDWRQGLPVRCGPRQWTAVRVPGRR